MVKECNTVLKMIQGVCFSDISWSGDIYVDFWHINLYALHLFCPSVLYFSWHRYEHQKFWPHLRESDYDNVGKEKGAGFNINVPWNKVGNHRNTVLKLKPEYIPAFNHIHGVK